MRVTTDYYAVLGVRRDASADQIKMAYRRLARELHPDVNPDPVTHERFKEITQAHEVLSDPDKRQMHDLGDDPFAAAGGYFGQARREPSKEDWYPRGRWESHRERRPPHPSGGAWNQYLDQAPYSDYLGARPPSSAYDWRLSPAVKPYRPRPVLGAIALMCVVVALAVLVVIQRHREARLATRSRVAASVLCWLAIKLSRTALSGCGTLARLRPSSTRWRWQSRMACR